VETARAENETKHEMQPGWNVAAKVPKVSWIPMVAPSQTAMGISPKTEFSIEERPFYATRDGHGRAVSEVFA